MPDSTAALVNLLGNPPNPMDQVAKTIGGINLLMQFRADQAASNAYQQSVDPTTGEFDMGKFNALLSQAPGGGWKFGQQMSQSGQGQQAQALGTSANIQSTLDQLGAQAGYLQPLSMAAVRGETVTAQQVKDLLASMPPGLVSPTRLSQMQNQVAGMTDAQATNWVLGAAYANTHAQEILRQRVPGFGTMPTGGGTIGYQSNPMAPGYNPPIGYTPSTPSPDQLNQPVTLTVGTQEIPNVPYQVASAIQQNPDLLKVYYPEQAGKMQPGDRISFPAPAMPPQGPPRTVPLPPAGSRSGGVTNNNFGTGGGRYPGEVNPLPNAATGPPTDLTGGMGGGNTRQPKQSPSPATGPLWTQPPGPLPPDAGGVGMRPQPGYNENVVVPSQQAATALTTAAADTPSMRSLINDMRSQINQPGWTPGLGAQAGSTFRQVLQRLGVNADPKAAPADINSAQAAQEEFAKDANLIASRQLATIGNPSDARQGLAEAITPGMAQSREGALGITATLMGNQDAINRTNAAWQQAQQKGWTSARHKEWLTKNWNATDKATGGQFDPRVFWLADTEGTADQQYDRMAKKIPKTQQAQFLKNVNYAKSQGWIKQNDDGSFAVVSP